MVLGLIIGSFFLFRDAVLQQTLAKVSNEMTVDYNSNFTVKKASFDGLSGLSMTGITLVPNKADTLFKIEKIKTTINLMKLLSGEVQLGTLDIQNGYIQLVKTGKTRNFDAFLKKDPSTEKNTDKRDYADYAYALITKILNLVPTDMVLDNLAFKINDNGNKTNINFLKLRLKNKQLETAAKSFVNDKTKNNITTSEIKISEIFNWFGGDFKTKKTSLIDFINKYSTVKIDKKAKVKYLDYNWSLNN